MKNAASAGGVPLGPGIAKRQGVWRFARLLLALVLAAGAVLTAERWRGQLALRSWKTQMATKGEVFDAKALWGPASARSQEFAKRLALATAQPRGKLARYAGQITGMVVEDSGACRRGSQEPCPLLVPSGGRSNSWQELNESLQQYEPTLKILRELMEDPPAEISYDYVKSREGDSFPNCVGIRIAAQSLAAAVMNDLHKGDLTAASQNLEALLAFAKLYENDPSLVSYMIRMAVIGLTVDVCWDALQAGGWTEPQLAALQRACVDDDRLLAQMPRTLEAERLARSYGIQSFRAHAYEAWIARHEEVFASFGCKPPASDVGPPARILRQYLFHPLWSFAWADQEELEFLRNQQVEVDALRAAVQQRSLLKLKEEERTIRLGYRAPAAAWRFYTRLPLVDTFSQAIGGAKEPVSTYPYPDFSKAWSTTMRNLTLHGMAKTAIALKRYELKHGKAPLDLAALAPEFLTTLPCDFMDGRPLRYRSNPGRSFTLYSVGEDFRDDGGDSRPGFAERKPAGAGTAWSGKDWVWAKVGASSEVTWVKKLHEVTSEGREE